MYNKIYFLHCLNDGAKINIRICKTKPKIKYHRGYSYNIYGSRVANSEIIYISDHELEQHNGVEYINDESPLAKQLVGANEGEIIKVITDGGEIYKYIVVALKDIEC